MEEELRKAKDEILIIIEKLKKENLEEEEYLELMEQSKHAFEDLAEKTKNFIDDYTASRKEETPLPMKEDKVGGGKRRSRKRSTLNKKRTLRKRRR
jgi:hypothetical protein